VCFEEGLARCEELGNKLLTSIGTGCLGSVYEKKGDFDKAMELFEKDLRLTEELGDKQGIAIATGLIGELLSVIGRFEEAEKHLQRTLQLSRELGYKKGIAKAVNTLGDVHYYTQQYEQSLEYYNQAIEVTREINNKLVLSSSLSEKAIVLLAMKRFQDVRDILAESTTLAEELGNPELIFEGKLLQLKLHIAEQQHDTARNILHKLLLEYPGTKERAALYYNQFLIDRNPATLQNALQCYQELYARTPRFLYKQRIEELQRIQNQNSAE
jgi:tetratricopeptide (TPR) repeat protein